MHYIAFVKYLEDKSFSESTSLLEKFERNPWENLRVSRPLHRLRDDIYDRLIIIIRREINAYSRKDLLVCCRNMLIRELAAVWVAVLLCHLQLTESQVSIQLYIPHRTKVLKARRFTLTVRSQLRLFMAIIGVHDPLAYYMRAARFRWVIN